MSRQEGSGFGVQGSGAAQASAHGPNRIIIGDCRDSLRTLADEGVRVQCCVTSPPYFGLRDYGHEGQIGLEPTPEEYVAKLVEVFAGVHRILADDGVLWVNLGDSYTGSANSGGSNRNDGGPLYRASSLQPKQGHGLKTKDLIGIPWRVAFALQADGWYLRQDIIWHKPNPMPESVTDRCTKAHEYLFLLTKNARYFWDAEAMKEASSEESGWAKQRAKGANTWKYNDTEDRKAATGQRIEASTFGEIGTRNRRSVWSIPTQPYSGAHFAVMPPRLAELCILAGSRSGDTVIDPFFGSGTTGEVAERLGRRWIGLDLNADYEPLQRERTAQQALPL
jgi:DNA modification methylase